MSNLDYSDLIASRICHDLINPVGAIANGVELLEMAGKTDPEIELISDGINNTSAKLRFYRVAFGQSDDKQSLSSHEIRCIFEEKYTERLTVNWMDADARQRHHVKAVFLTILCMEQALPRGGDITVSYDNGWSITAEADIIDAAKADWAALSECQVPETVSPNTVAFALLPMCLKRVELLPTVLISNTRLSVFLD